MRILSSFRDFYDTVQAYGQDSQVRFLRETSVISDLEPWAVPMPWDAERSAHGRYDGGPLGPDERLLRASHVHVRPALHPFGGHRDDRYLMEAFLLLGGTAHTLWVSPDRTLQHYGPGPTGLDGVPIAQTPAEVPLGFPDETTAVAWWTRHLRQSTGLTPAALGPDQTLTIKPREWEGKGGTRDANTYAALRQRVLDHDWSALHLAHGSPVLLIVPPTRGRYWYGSLVKEFKATLVVNPRLGDFQLQHSPAFDPYGVFQRLAQFIGGVMPGGQAPMAELSDRDQVRKKGFDPVYGFRTRPQAQR